MKAATLTAMVGSLVLAGCNSAVAASPDAGPLAQPADAGPLVREQPRAAKPAGPCGGRQVGEHACDGAKLLRCGADGATALERTCFDIEACDAQHAACAASCPSGGVYVPATGPGGFVMGRGVERHGFGSLDSGNGGHGISDGQHKVVLTRPFCMDESEATVAEYTACVDAGACTKPDYKTSFGTYGKRPDLPVSMIDWKQAKGFCAWAGKSLPTEAQWEWAATGDDRRVYPWGNDPPTCERADFTAGVLKKPACDCGCGGGGPSPVGTHPEGDKAWPSGRIHDLAGNVWEWCLDNYAKYGDAPEVDPMHHVEDDFSHVVRGGGWNRSGAALTTSFRGSAVVGYQRPALGARCVRNPT